MVLVFLATHFSTHAALPHTTSGGASRLSLVFILTCHTTFVHTNTMELHMVNWPEVSKLLYT